MIKRPYETKDIDTGRKGAIIDPYDPEEHYPNLWRYLKLNFDFSPTWRAGTILKVKVDRNGTPYNPWWRRRLRDAPIDNCVEWMPDDYGTSPTDWKPRPTPEPVPDPDGGKGKDKDKEKDK